MTVTIGLCLEPLDVLFFRDGRPFSGGPARLVSGMPLPQTVAGALRTALLRQAGCDFDRLRQLLMAGKSFPAAVEEACSSQYHWIGQMSIRGPWLARRQADTGNLEVLVRVPAILHRSKNKGEQNQSEKLRRLTPLRANELPGWDPGADQQHLRPLWLKEQTATEPAEGYLTPLGLNQFLQGDQVSADQVVSPSELFDRDFRTGISIDPDRLVAAESQIYGLAFLALKQDAYQRNRIVWYVEVSFPEAVGAEQLLDHLRTIPLGGEMRHVAIERLQQPFSWPSVRPQNEKQKPLILLTTPCPFRAGWRPQLLDGLIVAAAVPEHVPFSGWDLARGGPKPTRFAVPAGSVYFLQELPPHWQETLAESDEDRLLGWGCCLAGVWTDE